jgi:hypothetical protein
MEPLDTIFVHAREMADPAQRAAYLTQACGGDADVLRRVEAMLRDATAAEEYFGPAKASRPPVAPSTPSEGPGTWIGRYKLLETIGEGGMGVVYMAEQREPVLRKVAPRSARPALPEVIHCSRDGGSPPRSDSANLRQRHSLLVVGPIRGVWAEEKRQKDLKTEKWGGPPRELFFCP